MVVGVGHIGTHREVKEAFPQRNVYGISKRKSKRSMSNPNISDLSEAITG
jgi:hypothetical protein